MSKFAPSAVSLTSFSSRFLFSCVGHFSLCYKITCQLESLGSQMRQYSFKYLYLQTNTHYLYLSSSPYLPHFSPLVLGRSLCKFR